MSYHDLYITTPQIERTSIFDLPYSIHVMCCRMTGWQVWERWDGIDRLLGGEYSGPDKWLVLDVKGAVIVDSRESEDAS